MESAQAKFQKRRNAKPEDYHPALHFLKYPLEPFENTQQLQSQPYPAAAPILESDKNIDLPRFDNFDRRGKDTLYAGDWFDWQTWTGFYRKMYAKIEKAVEDLKHADQGPRASVKLNRMELEKFEKMGYNAQRFTAWPDKDRAIKAAEDDFGVEAAREMLVKMYQFWEAHLLFQRLSETNEYKVDILASSPILWFRHFFTKDEKPWLENDCLLLQLYWAMHIFDRRYMLDGPSMLKELTSKFDTPDQIARRERKLKKDSVYSCRFAFSKCMPQAFSEPFAFAVQRLGDEALGRISRVKALDLWWMAGCDISSWSYVTDVKEKAKQGPKLKVKSYRRLATEIMRQIMKDHPHWNMERWEGLWQSRLSSSPEADTDMEEEEDDDEDGDGDDVSMEG